MSAFVGTIDDINKDYIDLVPIGLRYCDGYLVYFALICKDNEIDLDGIESITDLIDISKTSYKFVDALWQYLNTHHEDKNRALDFYQDITNNLIAYGNSRGYLSVYNYLVPDNLSDEYAYKIYLIHLIELYSSDIENASVPEDLEDRNKVSLGTLENIWSYYHYVPYSTKTEEEKEALSIVVQAIRDIWEEKREEYLYMVPEYLRTNDGFLVFLSLMVHEFEIAQKNIDEFPNLVDSDKVPLKFLENLGSYINYRYLERADEDFNREALLSMRSIWEMRGTDHAIIMAATHGYNPGYVGGDMFIPGYSITNELAELIIGSTRVFVHSKSKFSCIHVYPDGVTYRPGVIILIVPFVDDNIRRKIIEVMPAGVRFVFWLFIAAQSDNPDETDIRGEMMYHIQVATLQSKGEPRYAYDQYTGRDLSIPINLFMTICPLVIYENEFDIDMFTHSVSPFPSYDEYGHCYYQHLLSGQRLFNIIDQLNTREPIVCAINLDLLKIPFMGPSYTGDYVISPSGEYLDTITTNGRPGTSSVRRKFDYFPEDDTILFLCSSVVGEGEDVDAGDSLDPYGIDCAVSALPIPVQSDFFAFNPFNTADITLLDNYTEIVREHLTTPFDIYDGSHKEGTINSNPIYLYSDRSFDRDYYIISATGEFLDTIDKDTNTVLRTLHMDYRPDVEVILHPKNTVIPEIAS